MSQFPLFVEFVRVTLQLSSWSEFTVTRPHSYSSHSLSTLSQLNLNFLPCPMAPTHDTRLLSNLIKAEKDAQASLVYLLSHSPLTHSLPTLSLLYISFKAWTKDSSSANAALNAWSLADSGDSKELMVCLLSVHYLCFWFTELARLGVL